MQPKSRAASAALVLPEFTIRSISSVDSALSSVRVLALGLFRGFACSSRQALPFCEVGRTKTFRGIEDAKSRTKWISEYRALPDCDVERGHDY